MHSLATDRFLAQLADQTNRSFFSGKMSTERSLLFVENLIKNARSNLLKHYDIMSLFSTVGTKIWFTLAGTNSESTIREGVIEAYRPQSQLVQISDLKDPSNKNWYLVSDLRVIDSEVEVCKE